MNISIQVRGQNLIGPKNLTSTMVEGSQEFIYFTFDLDVDWQGLTIFAQFIQNQKGYNVYLDNNNTVAVPPEIVNGEFMLVIYGIGLQSKIATSTALKFTMTKNELIADSESIDITPSLYEQMVELIMHSQVVPPYNYLVAGKVLAVNSTGDGLTWSEGGSGGGGLPSVDPTGDDDGKVLKVNGTTPEWEEDQTPDVVQQLVNGNYSFPQPSYSDAGKALVLTAVSTFSWMEWRTIVGLPTIDQNGDDDGKVLTVDGTHAVWDDPAGGLPDTGSANPGDVLSLDSNNDPEWAPIIQVPDYSSANDGDVLQIVNGQLEWAAPAGGLPDYSSAPNGASLRVIVQGSEEDPPVLEWSNVLPSIDDEGYDAGKILRVDGTQPSWSDPDNLPNPWSGYDIPEYNYADFNVGDVLRIQSQSTSCYLEWASPNQ